MVPWPITILGRLFCCIVESFANKFVFRSLLILREGPFLVSQSREYLRGKYHCTIDLLFDWFGLVCFENKNKNCLLSYS